MRYFMLVLVSLFLISRVDLTAQAQKSSPAKLVFQAKNGNVTYDHAAHAKREANNCKACHDTLWPQSAAAPLKFKSAMHKTAEQEHSSCASCHYTGGKAFAAKGACTKCHVRGKA